MGAAGSSNSQELQADNAESIAIVTKTENIAGKYSFIDFESGSGETILAIICVLLIFATIGLVYIKRRMIKKKLEHRMEMSRLKTGNRGAEEVAFPECRVKPDFQMSVYDPQVAKRHLEEVKKNSAQFSSRIDLLEARVFKGEI